MIKKMTAAMAAQIITFLWASRFPLMISPQPIATSTALMTMNVVLTVGNIKTNPYGSPFNNPVTPD